MSKECTKCKIEKELKYFSNSKSFKDWLHYSCRECNSKRLKEYFKTRKWLIIKIYNSQRRSSAKRGYNFPKYTNKELQQWCYNQDIFDELYSNWEKSWYKKDLVPSIDRINDYKSYSLDNIQLMTWQENKDKWHNDRKNWINNKHSKAVIWIHKITWETIEFYSMREAERQTWIILSNISQCCNWDKNHSHAWWYIWNFKNN